MFCPVFAKFNSTLSALQSCITPLKTADQSIIFVKLMVAFCWQFTWGNDIVLLMSDHLFIFFLFIFNVACGMQDWYYAWPHSQEGENW